MTYREICGCIHLHTTYSDGWCSYDTLIGVAGNAGLDYICVTDHMCLAGREIGKEGLFDNGVFVFIGYEHGNPKKPNHYIVFGTPKIADPTLEPQDYINCIKEMGGIGFIAHAAEKEDRFAFKSYPWLRWDAQGYDGLEIWNQLSDWTEQLRGLRITSLFRANRATRNAPQELLNKWDELNRSRFVSAIGGVDAHTVFHFIYPIKKELRGIRTHLFVDDAGWNSGDKAKMSEILISTMRDGKGYISNYYRGDAKGSRIFLQDENGATEYPGRPVNNLSLPMTLMVQLPTNAEIRLIRNGKVIHSTNDNVAKWAITEQGVYRVEAYKGANAWIYSNPFPVGQYPL